MKAKKSLPNGFTLIEMLVVIAIIGLLAALLFPAIDGALRQGRQTKCLSHLKAFGVAWNLDYLSTLSNYNLAEIDGIAPRLSSFYPDSISEPRMFICPSDSSNGEHGGKPTENQKYMEVAKDSFDDGTPKDYKETDDPKIPSSYLYEFSEAICSWQPGSILQIDELDGKSGISWAEAKLGQLKYGDGASGGQPYDPTSFPLVRCFHHFQDRMVKVKLPDGIEPYIKVLNVAMAGNIFISGPTWEYPLAP
jgi:prepilin-type N-terminal cleavage/methylation domain-containing protein